MSLSSLGTGKVEKLHVAVVGATGYSGAETIRLLFSHPRAILSAAYSTSHAGQVLGLVLPSLRNIEFAKLEEFDAAHAAEQADFFFLAGGHGRAMAAAVQLLDQGKKCLDIGADFRLKNPGLYPEWYKFGHDAPALLKEAVYGLSEWNRANIRAARLVANPGCYATAVLLALAPFVQKRVVATDGLVINGMSGISGAGRSATELAYHFPEAAENCRAYRVAAHQHTPEIEQELSQMAEEEVKVTFVPHVVPASRGLLATIFAPLAEQMNDEDAFDLLYERYRGATFVRVLPPGTFPETKNVRGSNFCDLSAKVDKRTGRLVLMSALDNLGKGAAGQAVQNMNLMCGFDEAEGLWTPPFYP